MKLITVSGPPSSGKTSLIIKTIESLKAQNIKVGIVKFDCLYTDDDILYEKAGILVKKGLSGSVCQALSVINKSKLLVFPHCTTSSILLAKK